MDTVKIKIIMPLLLVVLMISSILFGCSTIAAADRYPTIDLKDAGEETIFMHVGSPLILCGDSISFLDSKDFNVASTVYMQRTLIPLRAVSEYLGGDVSYNEKNEEAIVSYRESTYTFPINSGKIYADGVKGTETLQMDSKSIIINDRAMVPLRILAEQLFEKHVDYEDGVIVISNEPFSLSQNKELVAAVKSRIGMATKARSEAQLLSMMETIYNDEEQYFIQDIVKEMGVDAPTMDLSADGSSSAMDETDRGGGDFSDTNIQVQGVDEADIVKTDGKYLYYAGNKAVRIIKTDGDKLSEASIIKFPNEKNIREIYLDDNKLVILGDRNEGSDRYYNSGKTFAFVDVYDISDPAEPLMSKGHEMEGYYHTSRKIDSYVYLITNTGWYGGGIRPLMKDTATGGNIELMNISDIMVMPNPSAPGYVVLSAVDITDNSKTEVEALTAYGSTVYMSGTSLYIASEDHYGFTEINKFCVDGLNIGYAGSGKVEGNLLNQFSMDEYEGSLRIATTIWDEGNNLFILDESLNKIGSVIGLAKGERIYSVRFMGEKGYIVTFRNIDPLFVFDLSDPTSPRVTGELKIPGFSNYLHPVGEGLILGIGMETRELFERDAKGKETSVGFRQGGVKISLFDVSDMGRPREISNCIVGESGSYSEALTNHKAVMVDPVKQRIAFDSFIVKDKDWIDQEQGALIISYKNNNVKEIGFLKSEDPEVYGKYIPYGRRVVYIGDYIYYIQDGIINAFNSDSFEKAGSLMLK